MSIEEYLEAMRGLESLSDQEKEFLKNVCAGTGHDIFKDPNLFADVCVRCGHRESWINSYVGHTDAPIVDK